VPTPGRIVGLPAEKSSRSGLFTHLPVSDSLSADDVAFTNAQLDRFYGLVETLRAGGVRIPPVHIQSTYGVLNYPRLDCDFARVGLALYGVLSRSGEKTVLTPDFKPVLSLRSRVTLVRTIASGESVGYGRDFTAAGETTIAVVAAGFADGIPRALSDGAGSVLIRGRRATIAGRVCMDQLMIDVTGIPGVARGDVVTFIGRDGDLELRAEQVADDAGTITNELLSRLPARPGRLYKRSRRPFGSPL
jgi:serine/alanine racemase